MKVTPGASQQAKASTSSRAGTYTLYYEYRSKVDDEQDRQRRPRSARRSCRSSSPTARRQRDHRAARRQGLQLLRSTTSSARPSPRSTSRRPAPTRCSVRLERHRRRSWSPSARASLQSIWPWWLLGSIGAFVVASASAWRRSSSPRCSAAGASGSSAGPWRRRRASGTACRPPIPPPTRRRPPPWRPRRPGRAGRRPRRARRLRRPRPPRRRHGLERPGATPPAPEPVTAAHRRRPRGARHEGDHLL